MTPHAVIHLVIAAKDGSVTKHCFSREEEETLYVYALMRLTQDFIVLLNGKYCTLVSI
jgi:hypothetical protein